jgi:ABC-type branched-subunit amino acid transport system ATPase component
LALLEVTRVSKRFGGLVAVNEVDVTIEPGEIRGLIGPNGSGKSTLVNLVSGVYRTDGGEIKLEGRNITNLPAHTISHLHVSRTFQTIRLFGTLSVLENVMVGFYSQSKTNLTDVILNSPRLAREEAGLRKRAEELLELVELKPFKDQPGKSLTLGRQRVLEMARALATEPKLLILDEPAAGMNPSEKEWLVDVIRRINQSGVSILLIEHHMPVVMALAKRIAVMNFGLKIADGVPEEIRNNDAVIEAYLGRREDNAAIS